jgi:iron complex transport system substrate-binding protein
MNLQRRGVSGTALVLSLAFVFTAATGRASSAQATAQSQRIVSVVPAATEMLFAIGAGSRLVGVGSYDRFPPDINRLPRVGGLLDPNVELILGLKPTLVIVHSAQADLSRQLERAGIAVFLYTLRDLAGVLSTIRSLGAATGLQAAAEAECGRIESGLRAVSQRVEGKPRPRTLLVIGREPGSLRNILASGGYGFQHDVLQLAGGTDVFGDVHRESVQMSSEMVLARAPDVIIELHYGADMSPSALAAERAVWNQLTAVPAVKNGRVYLLQGDEFVVPGPRVVQAATKLAETIHGGGR